MNRTQVNPGPERDRPTHQDAGLLRTAHPCQPRLPMHGDRLQRLHPLQGGPWTMAQIQTAETSCVYISALLTVGPV